MAILGGASSLTGPIVGAAIITLVKNVVSTYVERWNTLLGVIFVVVIMFMPYGLVPGLPAAVAQRDRTRRRPQGRGNDRVGAGRMTTPALRDRRPAASASAACRRPATSRCAVMPGERRLIIGPNGAGKTTLFNLITGDLTADSGSVKLFGRELLGMPTQDRVHLGLARTYQILTLFPRETLIHNVVLSLLGLDRRRWNPWSILTGQPRPLPRRA